MDICDDGHHETGFGSGEGNFLFDTIFAIEPKTIAADTVKELKHVILNNDLKQLTKDYKSGKLWEDKHNEENRRTPNL